MTIKEWYIFALSMLPFTELRGSIPLAITMGMAPWWAFVVAVAGNLVPVLPILLLLTPGQELLTRFFPPLERVFQKILRKTRGKGEQVKKYGALGLLLFVAVPLPGTGAWTGALLAWLFGLPVFTAFVSIVLGVVLAGVIVTLVTVGAFEIAYYYGFEFLLVFLLLILLFYAYRKWVRT